MADQPSPEALARNRFLIINAVRFGGVIITLLGLLVENGLWGLPRIVGYGMIAFGIVATFFIPLVLARLWSSNRER